MSFSVPQEFTDEELVAYARASLVRSTGGALTINGRSVQPLPPPDAMKILDYAEARIAARNSGFSGGGNILVDFNR